MTLTPKISCSLLAFTLSASAAAADLTGPQVWQDWQDYLTGIGYTVTGTESQSGDTLTVSGVRMSIEFEDGSGGAAITLNEVTFEETSGGQVAVSLPGEIPVDFETILAEDDPATGTLLVTQVNPSMIVSGDPEDLTYTFSAETMGYSLRDLVVDGIPMPAETFNMAVNMTEVANRTRMQIGTTRAYTQTTTAADLSYDVTFDVTDTEPSSGTISGRLAGLQLDAEGALPLDADVSDPAAMLGAGTDINGGFAHSGGTMMMNITSPDGVVATQTSSESGTVRINFGADGLGYDVTGTNVAINLEQIPDFPFPVQLDLARTAFRLALPVEARDAPQDFSFGLTLADFTISDNIWGLFDPAGQLPRDPATVDIGLSGALTLLTGMMEADAADEPGTIPGEIEALDIDTLRLSAVGTEVTGTGGFTFDNSAPSAFNGLPQPLGAVDMRVEGANALLDTLVQMGLLPEEQAMGARMMIGLFGVPQGDDVITSRIEINEQGHVLANGQRLQ